MKFFKHPAEKSAYQSVSLKIVIFNERDAICTSGGGDDPYRTDGFTDTDFETVS